MCQWVTTKQTTNIVLAVTLDSLYELRSTVVWLPALRAGYLALIQ